MIVSSGRTGLCALLIGLAGPVWAQTSFPRFLVCEQAVGYGASGGKIQALRIATEPGETSWLRIDTRDGDIEEYTLTGRVRKSLDKTKFSIDRTRESDFKILYFRAPHETVKVTASDSAIHFAMTVHAVVMHLYAGTCRPG